VLPPPAVVAAATAAGAAAIAPTAPVISGWFPIYDTLKGVRGELQLAIRLEGFENANPLADPSAGV
jgi:hypothetical protein